MTRRIDISSRTVVFITVFLLGLWVIYQILDLILLLFVAVILTSALSPVVDFLQKQKLPKPLSIIIIYIVILLIFGSILTVSFTPLIEETSKLSQTLPATLGELLRVGNIDLNFLQSQLQDLSKNVFSFTLIIFDNIIRLVLILVITFYLLLERENLEKRVASLFANKEERVKKLIEDIEEKLGGWLRGQLLLSLIIGVSVYLGLTLLQIPYALSLAILSGFLEVIPVIGPILAATPAIILALGISPVLAAGVAAMYFVVQQLEAHVVIPQVMKKAVGLNPLIVILAIAVGGRLLGIGGALLAVPITVVLQVIFVDILKEKITS